MIERDRRIIAGLQRIQTHYARICYVLADRDTPTADPIGAALDLAALAALREDLQQTSAAVARRLLEAAEVVDGQVVVGELDGGNSGGN